MNEEGRNQSKMIANTLNEKRSYECRANGRLTCLTLLCTSVSPLVRVAVVRSSYCYKWLLPLWDTGTAFNVLLFSAF